MNPEAKVLQAVDAAQKAFDRIRGARVEERSDIARRALLELMAAPWSMAMDETRADQHGWLGEVRETLRKIENDPGTEEIERLCDTGRWAANELERDLRTLVGAR